MHATWGQRVSIINSAAPIPSKATPRPRHPRGPKQARHARGDSVPAFHWSSDDTVHRCEHTLANVPEQRKHKLNCSSRAPERLENDAILGTNTDAERAAVLMSAAVRAVHASAALARACLRQSALSSSDAIERCSAAIVALGPPVGASIGALLARSIAASTAARAGWGRSVQALEDEPELPELLTLRSRRAPGRARPGERLRCLPAPPATGCRSAAAADPRATRRAGTCARRAGAEQYLPTARARRLAP